MLSLVMLLSLLLLFLVSIIGPLHGRVGGEISFSCSFRFLTSEQFSLIYKNLTIYNRPVSTSSINNSTMFQLQNLTADQNGTEVGCTTNGYVSDFLPILILSEFNTHISLRLSRDKTASFLIFLPYLNLYNVVL